MPVPSDPPPRVPATSPALPSPLPAQAPVCQRPSLIKPDDGDPVRHRYHLRSQTNLAKLLPSHQQSNSVIDSATGNVHKYYHLARGPGKFIWIKILANDLGRLAQGVGSRMPTGTNTLYFCHPLQISPDRKVTYAKLVATLRPQKEEEHRVRMTVGGDKLDYPGITTTDTASLSTLKLLLNSVISTPLACFLTLNIKNYYYNTPM